MKNYHKRSSFSFNNEILEKRNVHRVLVQSKFIILTFILDEDTVTHKYDSQN